MATERRAWFTCDTDGCDENSSNTDSMTVEEARWHVRDFWVRSLDGVRGDFCDVCVEKSKAKASIERLLR